MSSEELTQLLGEGAAAAGAVTSHTSEIEQSETVLKTDRWTRRKGAQLAEQWAELGVEGVTKDDTSMAADAIETLLSSKPTPAENPKDLGRARWWQQLMSTPECAALRSRTVLQPAVAEIAAAELAKQWVAYAAETSEEEQQGGDDESPEASVNRMRSVREALNQAEQAAEEAEAVGAGLGLGTGSSLETRQLAQYTRRLRGSANLAGIMRMAGKFIAKAQRLQRQRLDLPGMEITGVDLSGDLGRLLPIESSLVAGAVPELEVLALAKLAQRRSLSYRRTLRTPVQMGPIVVSVDESASMSGERIEAAKGLALAMASIARAQKRPFLLCAWSGTPEIRVASDSTEAIVEWLEGFFCGGTSLQGPLHTLPTEAWPEGKVGAQSDHIIITDDDVGLSDELLSEYQAFSKRMNLRTFGIGVGVRKTTTLAKFCNGGVWCLPELDLNNPAVDVVLSIGPTTTTTS